MRVLPHNREAEAAVLGAIILRGEAALWEAAEHVVPQDFHEPAGEAVFAAALALAQRRSPIDEVTVEAELRAMGQHHLLGLEGLGRLADRYRMKDHVGHHAAMIRDLARARAVVLAAGVAVDLAEEAVGDPAAWADQQAEAVASAAARGRRERAHAMNAVLRKVFVGIHERAKNPDALTGVSTGFRELDKLTSGLQAKELAILAARPSMGKTALALDISRSVATVQVRHLQLHEEDRPVREPVLFFSLEMGEDQLVARMLCADARVDFSLMRSGAFVDEDLRTLVRSAERMAPAPFFVDDQAAPTILEMRARARAFRSRRDLFPVRGEGAACEHCGVMEQQRCLRSCPTRRKGLVVIDYLQLARGAKRHYDSREQEISDISQGLKAMAKELDCPVLALSQLNRAVDGRADHRPQLSDLRESGAIEQDADLIMFVSRPERYLSPDAPEEELQRVRGLAEVIIGKQRNGPIGVVELTFLAHLATFADREPSERAPRPPQPAAKPKPIRGDGPAFRKQERSNDA